MTVEGRIIALIRTVVPYLWSALITWIIGRVPWVQDVIAWLNEFSGQDVTAALGLLFAGLVLAGYYWLARKAGARWPFLERWLMGRSVVPVYTVEFEQSANGTWRAKPDQGLTSPDTGFRDQ